MTNVHRLSDHISALEKTQLLKVVTMDDQAEASHAGETPKDVLRLLQEDFEAILGKGNGLSLYSYSTTIRIESYMNQKNIILFVVVQIQLLTT